MNYIEINQLAELLNSDSFKGLAKLEKVVVIASGSNHRFDFDGDAVLSKLKGRKYRVSSDNNRTMYAFTIKGEVSAKGKELTIPATRGNSINITFSNTDGILY